MLFDGFAELDLLQVALLGVEFGAQAVQALGGFGGVVAFSGGLLASGSGKRGLVGWGLEGREGGGRTFAHRDRDASRAAFASVRYICAMEVS